MLLYFLFKDLAIPTMGAMARRPLLAIIIGLATVAMCVFIGTKMTMDLAEEFGRTIAIWVAIPVGIVLFDSIAVLWIAITIANAIMS
jgi:hypothetical protein